MGPGAGGCCMPPCIVGFGPKPFCAGGWACNGGRLGGRLCAWAGFIVPIVGVGEGIDTGAGLCRGGTFGV